MYFEHNLIYANIGWILGVMRVIDRENLKKHGQNRPKLVIKC